MINTALETKQLEINALLEITQAINTNLPEDALYKIFHFTIRANLHITRLALLVWENVWIYKSGFGVHELDIAKKLNGQETLFETITYINDNSTITYLKDFEVLIPVIHKKTVLAYVLLGSLLNGESIPTDKIKFISTLSNILLVAIENKRFAQKQLHQEALNKELTIARNVQSLLFPETLPNTDLLKIKATYIPHYTVGGDYYDYIVISKNKFLVCMADVSGKGIPAAMLMSNFQATLRTLCRQNLSLSEIVNELNYSMKETSKGDYFVTAFLGEFDLENKKFSYVSAGHNPAIWCSNGKSSLINDGTIMLGSFDKLPFLSIGELDLEDDNTLFLYTDGLSEADNDKDEEWGMERIEEYVNENKDADLDDFQTNLLSLITKHKGEKDKFRDDVTWMILKLKLPNKLL